MNFIEHKSAIVCGICVILASLSSGCATQIDPQRVTMSTEDLNYFKVDCRRKAEQIALLQSLRVSRDDQFAARMRATLKPYEVLTDRKSYQINSDMGFGNPNKYINFHLKSLSECP